MGRLGLVMEGGAMRGMFTAGVTDVLMENGIEFDGGIGVSAGAAFGCNYVSRQPHRVIRYNLRFCKDMRFCSVASWILTGNLYNATYGYNTIPEKYDLFDYDEFKSNPMEFYSVATDLESGQPVYHKYTDCKGEDMLWLRASASLPIASKPVRARGRVLLDGGLTDSIPLRYFESIGYERNVVIATRSKSYRKKPTKGMLAIRLALKDYPLAIKAIENRHNMYNEEVKYIFEAEKAGRAFVIRPFAELNIGSVCRDREELKRVYKHGRRAAKERLDELKAWLAQNN